jgi:hypothetical protein
MGFYRISNSIGTLVKCIAPLTPTSDNMKGVYQSTFTMLL